MPVKDDRDVLEDDETAIKAPKYPKGFESTLAKEFDTMMVSIATQFANQTLKELNKTTVEKFQDPEGDTEDAMFSDAKQTGNYAVRFETLAKRSTKKIRKRWSDKRLHTIVERVMLSLNKNNQLDFYGKVSKIQGISVERLIQEEGLKENTNALILETELWARRLRDSSLQNYTANSLRVMSQGASLDDTILEYKQEVGKSRSNAKMNARSQVANFNGMSNKIRYQNLGITEAIWRTSGNEKVRKSHKDRDGKRYSLEKGLYSSIDQKWLLPGVDYNCVCTGDPIIPEE